MEWTTRTDAHIFGEPRHNLDLLVRQYGNEEAVGRAIVDAVNIAFEGGDLIVDDDGCLSRYSISAATWLQSVDAWSPASSASERRGFPLDRRMAMEALSPVESQIIRSLIAKQYGPGSPFLDQLAGAYVDSRRMTGAGVFVDLRIGGNVGPVDDANCEITEGYPTSLPPQSDRIGFTLFIRKGYLSFLEGSTFGDVAWPDKPMEDWLFFDEVRMPDQKAK